MERRKQLKERHVGKRMSRTQPPIKWDRLQGRRSRRLQICPAHTIG